MLSNKLQHQPSSSSNKSWRGRSRRTRSESAAPTSTLPRSHLANEDNLSVVSISAVPRASTLRVGKRWQGKAAEKFAEKLSTILENAASRIKSESEEGFEAPISLARDTTAGTWWTWLVIPGFKHSPLAETRRDPQPDALSEPAEHVEEDLGAPTPAHDVSRSPSDSSNTSDDTDSRAYRAVQSLDQVVVSPTGVLWIPAPSLVPPTTLSVNSNFSTSSLPSRITSNADPSRITLATTPGQSSTQGCSPVPLLPTPILLLEEVEVVNGDVAKLDTTTRVGLGLNLDPVSGWTDEEEDAEVPVPVVQLPSLPSHGQGTPVATYKRSPGQSTSSSRSSRRNRDRDGSLFWSMKHNRWRGDGSLRHEMYFRWFEDRCSNIDGMLVEAAVIEFEWDHVGEDEFQDVDLQETGWVDAVLTQAGVPLAAPLPA